MKFTTTILSFDEHILAYGPYFKLPKEETLAFLEKHQNNKRIKCIINGLTIDRAISRKEDFFYILLSKEVLKQLKVNINDSVSVSIQTNTSKYGVDITEEMEEVLFQDPDGSDLFHKLTPGKQRSLIFFINKIKSSQLRVEIKEEIWI
jgi:Domain of unknown function (DUF1905)